MAGNAMTQCQCCADCVSTISVARGLELSTASGRDLWKLCEVLKEDRKWAKGSRPVAGLRLCARLGSRLSIKHGALALPNDFLIGSGGVALQDIDSPGAPQDCVGYPLTSWRHSLQGIGNGLPQPRIRGGPTMPACWFGAQDLSSARTNFRRESASPGPPGGRRRMQGRTPPPPYICVLGCVALCLRLDLCFECLD